MALDRFVAAFIAAVGWAAIALQVVLTVGGFITFALNAGAICAAFAILSLVFVAIDQRMGAPRRVPA